MMRLVRQTMLSSPAPMRRTRLIDRINSRTGIINSSRRHHPHLTLRLRRRLNSLHLRHSIRYHNKFIHGRRQQQISRHRHSRSTLTRATKRLVQMIISPAFHTKSTRTTRHISNPITYLHLARLIIRTRNLRRLYTSTMMQIRTQRQILRSRNRHITTRIPRIVKIRNSRIDSIRPSLTFSINNAPVRRTRSHLYHRTLTKTKLTRSHRNTSTINKRNRAVSNSRSTILDQRNRTRILSLRRKHRYGLALKSVATCDESAVELTVVVGITIVEIAPAEINESKLEARRVTELPVPNERGVSSEVVTPPDEPTESDPTTIAVKIDPTHGTYLQVAVHSNDPLTQTIHV